VLLDVIEDVKHRRDLPEGRRGRGRDKQ
jgi:hypothetical protein